MKLDDLKKLHISKKYRQSFGCFIVEGEHPVLELQKAAQYKPELLGSELYVTDAYRYWSSPFNTHIIPERTFRQIADTENPQGILAVAPLPRAAAAPSVTERAMYLHEIQDPGNLGTILRSLAWFGGFRLLLSPGSVDPYNPKVVRASMGALFHVPLELDIEWQALARRFTRIAALDLAGTSTRDAAFAGFDCYLFGNEARGLPEDVCAGLAAARFSIEGAGVLESLNLATAVNICAYELAGAGAQSATNM
ncbi:MAG: RNA methyltransferase [Pseudomonadales bacterium]|jgi:TrmH family RNA methyltransferase|nr:RNA methyltransferase [Pseudomonadales bacterium]